jgi:hypothetical protein
VSHNFINFSSFVKISQQKKKRAKCFCRVFRNFSFRLFTTNNTNTKPPFSLPRFENKMSNANKVPASNATQGDLANEFYNPLYVQKVTSFKLIRQESQGTDQASRSGLFYNYHVVVKKTAFTVTLGLGSDVVMAGQKINFKNMKLEAKLCFDSDVCNEVPYVKEKPLEYSTKVSERGDQVEVECKIQVVILSIFYYFRISFCYSPLFFFMTLFFCFSWV